MESFTEQDFEEISRSKAIALVWVCTSFDFLIRSKERQTKLESLIGKNGEKLIEYQETIVYDDYHLFLCETLSFDIFFLRTGLGMPLLLQYGQHTKAHEALDLVLANALKVMDDPTSLSYKMDLVQILSGLPILSECWEKKKKWPTTI